MSKVWSIYGLIDPRSNELKYIGCSASVKTRVSIHKSNAKMGLTDCSSYDWLRELASLSLEPIVTIESTHNSKDAAFEAECVVIAAHGHLLNKSSGGLGAMGTTRSAETRTKMGKAKRGIAKTRTHRTRLAASGGGRPFKDDLGNVYQNIHEAGAVLGINYQNIWKVLHGKRSMAGGRAFYFL